MKIIRETDIYISIIDESNNNMTKSFQKVLVDDDGQVIGENPNFKAEVEAFAGEGFLDK